MSSSSSVAASKEKAFQQIVFSSSFWILVPQSRATPSLASKRFVVSSIATKKVGAQHNVTFSEKRSLHRRAPHDQDCGHEPDQRQEGSTHLVPPVYHPPGLRRPHHRRPQRTQVHPGLRHGKHGRP